MTAPHPLDRRAFMAYFSGIGLGGTLFPGVLWARLQEAKAITKDVLDEHAALIGKCPTMERDEPYMAHVPPGKTGEIVWTFNRAGQFEFACLIAGHYQAGMVGLVTVIPVAGRPDAVVPGRKP